MTGVSVRSIQHRIPRCARCPRLRDYCARVAAEKRRAYRDDDYWGRPVPGFGDPAARLLVVGLAPGAHGANRTGRLFTGDSSGEFLMGALHAAGFASMPTSVNAGDGLRLTGAYITAAVRCAPPDNRPSPKEIGRCLPWLAAELRELRRVRVVVALGRIAYDATFRVLRELGMAARRRPPFGHLAVCPLDPPSPTVVASYHPSRQNTNTGRLTRDMIDEVFRAARSLLGE